MLNEPNSEEDFAIYGHYLNKPLPPVDAKAFDEFMRQSDLHFQERKKCKHWKRVETDFKVNGKKMLSHFGDCHNLNNKTHNCGYNLCPIRSGDNYDHDK